MSGRAAPAMLPCRKNGRTFTMLQARLASITRTNRVCTPLDTALKSAVNVWSMLAPDVIATAVACPKPGSVST